MPRFRLRLNDQEREFDTSRQGDRLHLVSAEMSVDVSVVPLDDRWYLLEFTDADGIAHRLRVAGLRAGDKRQLWVDGRYLEALRLHRQQTASTVSDASLAATIPAIVSQILVSVGDEVAPGDKLILLESMKMVIPIQAPFAGRVSAIHCAAGESVPAGLNLVEMEPL